MNPACGAESWSWIRSFKGDNGVGGDGDRNGGNGEEEEIEMEMKGGRNERDVTGSSALHAMVVMWFREKRMEVERRGRYNYCGAIAKVCGMDARGARGMGGPIWGERAMCGGCAVTRKELRVQTPLPPTYVVYIIYIK